MEQHDRGPTPALLHAQPRTLGRRARIAGAALALLLLAGLGWLAWHLTHRDAAEGGQAGQRAGAPAGRGGPGAGGGGGRRGAATTVGVATAELADIPVMLDALGTVAAAATVTVRPQVSGVLRSVDYQEGQMVRKGQLLATIDPRQFEMALMQATGQLQRDRAQLENARLTLQRYRTLLGQDSIARQEVDTQAALVKQLEGAIVAGRAAEGTARINLGYTRIVAPIAGRVGLRTVDVGNVVGANDANGIAVITQVSPIDVEFALPQDRVPELAGAAGKRLPVEAYDRTRSTVLATGVFHALDNQVDTQTGTVRAKARFANANLALFPSQFVNVRVRLRTIDDAVVVPVTAVRHGSGGDFVFVLDAPARTVSMRPVTRGEADARRVRIVSGLEAGEQVITEGADRLKDGSRVTLPGDRPNTGARGGRGGRRGGGDAAAPAAPAAGAAGTENAVRPRGARPAGAQPAADTGAQAPAAGDAQPAADTGGRPPATDAERAARREQRRQAQAGLSEEQRAARREERRRLRAEQGAAGAPAQ